MFVGEGVQVLIKDENSLCIVDTIGQFFKRTAVDWQVNPKREERRQMRMRMLGINTENGAEGMDPEGKYYKVNPTIKGRITVIGQ